MSTDVSVVVLSPSSPWRRSTSIWLHSSISQKTLNSTFSAHISLHVSRVTCHVSLSSHDCPRSYWRHRTTLHVIQNSEQVFLFPQFAHTSIWMRNKDNIVSIHLTRSKTYSPFLIYLTTLFRCCVKQDTSSCCPSLRRGMSGAAARLSATQERQCSVELGSYLCPTGYNLSTTSVIKTANKLIVIYKKVKEIVKKLSKLFRTLMNNNISVGYAPVPRFTSVIRSMKTVKIRKTKMPLISK
jgi:hypothetical protein